jgi:hypothetical protein
MNISLQNLDHIPWGDHYFCLDVCPGHDAVHYFYHLVMNKLAAAAPSAATTGASATGAAATEAAATGAAATEAAATGAAATGAAAMGAAATGAAATGAAATGAAATGAAAKEAAATEAAATRAAARGAAVLGAAPPPPAKRLKSAAFVSRASARSAVVSKRREGRLSGSFALESPEKILGIEEMDEDLSFQFEDGELQREEEKEEQEVEEQREEEEDVDEQREEDEKPAHRPLKPSLPSQQGFTCSSCLSRNHFTAYPFCVCCGYKVL